MTSCRSLGIAAITLLSCERASRESAPQPGASPSAIFRDVTSEAGISFVHANGASGDFLLPEIMGSGCAWIDYDRDGDIDAYLVSAGFDPKLAKNRLYRNEGDGKFTDVTDASGAGDRGFGMGCAVGDYDADGFPDIYVTNFGPNVLLRNGGAGTFSNLTSQAGLVDSSRSTWSASAAFVDVDEDGDLDLFVTSYMKHPRSGKTPCADEAGRPEYCGPNSHYPKERCTVYINLGNGSFRDDTQAAGMDRVTANGLGVTCGDFNDDGHTDIYVACDENPNQLWLGDGKGHFADRAIELGAAFNQHGQPQAGMGVHAEDIDADGFTDIFVTNLANETNAFYRGSSRGFFEDVISRAALAAPSLPRTGFGTGFLDFDHDGDLDLIVVNGRVTRGLRAAGDLPPPPWDLYAETDQLFENVSIAADPTSQLRFEERTAQAGAAFSRAHVGRGLALGDYDNDGDVDALITECGGPARLLRNDALKRGRWLSVRVQSKKGVEIRGARITVTAGTRKWARRAEPAYGYLSSSDSRVHFGLGLVEASTAAVEAQWPDGTRTLVPSVPLDSFVVIEKTSESKEPR